MGDAPLVLFLRMMRQLLEEGGEPGAADPHCRLQSAALCLLTVNMGRCISSCGCRNTRSHGGRLTHSLAILEARSPNLGLARAGGSEGEVSCLSPKLPAHRSSLDFTAALLQPLPHVTWPSCISQCSCVFTEPSYKDTGRQT